MNITKLLILLFAITLFVSLTLPAFAEDGAGIFKAKCAMCHGPEGQGKIGPKLAGTALTADKIADFITKGDDAKKAPHKKPIAGLSAADVKAVAAFVKTLK